LKAAPDPILQFRQVYQSLSRVFRRSPFGELLIGLRIEGPGLDLENDGIVLKGKKRVPRAAPAVQADVSGFAADKDKAGVFDMTVVIHCDEPDGAAKQHETLGFRIRVSMRLHITSGLHRIDHPLQRFGVILMKRMDFSTPGIVARIRRLLVDQGFRDCAYPLVIGARCR